MFPVSGSCADSVAQVQTEKPVSLAVTAEAGLALVLRCRWKEPVFPISVSSGWAGNSAHVQVDEAGVSSRVGVGWSGSDAQKQMDETRLSCSVCV